MILEYRKGYLFVRFNDLDIDFRKLVNIIKSDNLYNIVININNINLNNKIIRQINLLNNMAKKNNGNIYICGKKINNIKNINSELDVFKIGEII